MGTKSRHVDIGTSRARDLTIRVGQELRNARTDRGLSLGTVGGAVALSISQVSRIERGLVARVSIRDLARLHAVVGLDLSVKSYPSGQPIRDAVHVRLLDDLRGLLHRSLRWSLEVPIPLPGDQRSWDAMIRADSWRYTVEAETAPRDAQALVRRIQLSDGTATLMACCCCFVAPHKRAVFSTRPVNSCEPSFRSMALGRSSSWARVWSLAAAP